MTVQPLQTGTAMAALASDGAIKFCNTFFTKLTGYTEQYLRTLNIENLCPRFDIKSDEGREYQLFTQNGEVIPVVVNHIGLNDTEVVIALQDLRWSQELSQMEQYINKIDESRQCLEQFSAVVAHDLKAPLRKINIFAKQLRADYNAALGADGVDVLDRMIRASERLAKLIDSLLAYACSNSAVLHLERVDLDRVLQHILQDIDHQIEQSETSFEIGSLPEVEADSIQMQQLLTNLVSNAVKFSKPGEPNHIRIWSENVHRSGDTPQVRLFVQDTGIGFDESNSERIFKTFEQLNPKRSPEKGSGLGLAICKRIVDRLGGAITVKSQPGSGSVFIVSLPQYQSNRQLVAH